MATAKIREYNKDAVIDEVQFNNDELPLTKLLELNMFSLERALEVDSEILEKTKKTCHDSRIGTFSYKMEAEMTHHSADKFLMKAI